MSGRGRGMWMVTALLTGMVGVAAPLAAQGGDGFLFKEPKVSISARFGYAAPLGPRTTGGDSDIFGFTQGLLTIADSDHDAASFGGEIAFRVSPRFDLLFDVSYAKSNILSEFRDWVDADDLPIEQRTEFKRIPVTLSGRYFLADRGRQLSQFAWVPTQWVPYLGGGVGFTRYTFEQDGDFVDFETLEIFGDRLISSGRAFTAHALAGVQYSLTPMVILNGEARYSFGSDALTDDDSFVGFDNIDLSGLHFSVGLGVRF